MYILRKYSVKIKCLFFGIRLSSLYLFTDERCQSHQTIKQNMNSGSYAKLIKATKKVRP